jgi:hypothetical protein
MVVDLRPGPIIVETPLQALGMFDDWRNGSESSISACLARIAGEGSRFLLVPPGYVDPVGPSRPMMRK